VLTQQLSENKGLVVFNKTIPDADSAITMGKEMIRAFRESTDLAGWAVKEIELPLSAQLYTETGEATQFKLIGYIDLLLQDPAGNLVVVDHKTAARAKSQAEVDSDMQMTTYSYLLAANKYVFPTGPVNCRFDVLRKLKTPKLVHYHTVRTAADRKRLAKIATGVLAGIEARVFLPTKGWIVHRLRIRESMHRLTSLKITPIDTMGIKTKSPLAVYGLGAFYI
jgi:putative RecB family exonuclease